MHYFIFVLSEASAWIFLLVNSEIQMEGVRIGDNIIHYFTDFLFFASDPWKKAIPQFGLIFLKEGFL